MVDQTTDRFRVHSDNLTGLWRYEFFDRGVCVERGEVASPQIVGQRYLAFKALRPWEDESNG
jgi:hypothetical protein